MNNLREKFTDLDSEKKRFIQIRLTRRAIGVWEVYIAKKKRISYRDSVVGMKHRVDLHLPSKALECVERKEKGERLAENYLEPISALQDDDWNLPDRVLYSYYAIYNLFQKYCKGVDTDDWMIVIQSLSSLGSPEETQEILESELELAERIEGTTRH